MYNAPIKDSYECVVMGGGCATAALVAEAGYSALFSRA